MVNSEYSLPAESAWRLYELLEELNAFLHNPAHFADPEQAAKWLTNGVYAEVRHAYYELIGPWFPIDETTGEVRPPPETSATRTPQPPAQAEEKTVFSASSREEKIALLRAIAEAKFHDAPNDTDVPGSSILASVAVRLRDAAIAEDVQKEGAIAERRWREWIRLDATRYEWHAAQRYAVNAWRSIWPQWSAEDRKLAAITLLSPFEPGDEAIEKFLHELESQWS